MKTACPLDALQALLSEPPSGRRPRARHSRRAVAVPLDERWLALVQAHRLDELRTALLQQQRVLGLVAWLEQLVSPLAARVGEAWAAGELSVYQEHLFTEAVDSLLRETAAALEAGPAGPVRQPRVLLTTLPGELHTLGLLMAQAVLAMERCDTLMLGPNTPLNDVAQAVSRLDVDVVALGTSAHAQPRALVPELQRLRSLLPATVPLWVGGPAQTALGRRPLPDIVAVQHVGALQTLVQSWRVQRVRTAS